MKSKLSIHILVALLIAVQATIDPFENIVNLQQPPLAIVLPPGVEYPYDPSDYSYFSYGDFIVNNQYIGGVISKNSSNLAATSMILKMPETEFGGWDLNKPALFLLPNNTVSWYYMQSKTDVPSPSAQSSYQFNSSESVICYDILAIDQDTLIVDCAQVNDTQYIVNNYIYVIDISSTPIVNSYAQSILEDNLNTTSRKIALYNNGERSFVYRLTLPNDGISYSTYIEVLDVTDLTNITSYTIINSDSVNQFIFTPSNISLFTLLLFFFFDWGEVGILLFLESVFLLVIKFF